MDKKLHCGTKCGFHYYLEIHHHLETRHSVASESEAWNPFSDSVDRKTRPRSRWRLEGGQKVVKRKALARKGFIENCGVCACLYVLVTVKTLHPPLDLVFLDVDVKVAPNFMSALWSSSMILPLGDFLSEIT
jgi:hypothetical protein